MPCAQGGNSLLLVWWSTSLFWSRQRGAPLRSFLVKEVCSHLRHRVIYTQLRLIINTSMKPTIPGSFIEIFRKCAYQTKSSINNIIRRNTAAQQEELNERRTQSYPPIFIIDTIRQAYVRFQTPMFFKIHVTKAEFVFFYLLACGSVYTRPVDQTKNDTDLNLVRILP